DLAREREGRAPDHGEWPLRPDPHPDVRPARAARLGPAHQPVLVEHLLGHPGHLDDLRPRHPRHRIEIDAQLVGPIHVLAAHRVRVEIDAAEVDDIHQLRRVVDHDLVGVPPRGKRERGDVDPRGPLGRRALLVERLALRAVDEALEDLRPARHPAQRAVGNGQIILHQLELRDPRPRKVDLLGVRYSDLAPGELQDLLPGLCHAPSLARSALPPHGSRRCRRQRRFARCSSSRRRWSWPAQASPSSPSPTPSRSSTSASRRSPPPPPAASTSWASSSWRWAPSSSSRASCPSSSVAATATTPRASRGTASRSPPSRPSCPPPSSPSSARPCPSPATPPRSATRWPTTWRSACSRSARSWASRPSATGTAASATPGCR